jgi:hypothetical protein
VTGIAPRIIADEARASVAASRDDAKDYYAAGRWRIVRARAPLHFEPADEMNTSRMRQMPFSVSIVFARRSSSLTPAYYEAALRNKTRHFADDPSTI